MAQKQQDHHLYFEGKVQTEGYFSKNEVKYIDVYISYGPLHTVHLHLRFSSFPCLRKKKKQSTLK